MRKKRWLIFLILLGGIIIYSNDGFSELAQSRDISISSKDALSAWTQPKGRFYNQLTYSYHVSDHKFTTIRTDKNGIFVGTSDDAVRVETAKFTAHSITYHGEYGITDMLTVFARIPWIKTRYDEIIKFSGEEGPSGIGDIDFGLRYNLSKNLLGTGVLMSSQGAVKIHEAYEYKHPLIEVSLGDGQYDVTLALLFGKDWAKGYALLNAGYKYRFENNEFDPLSFKPSDEIRVLIGGGYFLTSKLLLRGSIDWTKSVGNASVSNELILENFKFGGTFREQDHVLIKDTLGLEQDILNLGIALSYNITQQFQTVLFYNIDVEGIGVFRTRDAGQVATYSLAMVYMF
jgi:hypothetical protein